MSVRVDSTRSNNRVVRALVEGLTLRTNEVILAMVLTESNNLSVGFILDGSSEDCRFESVLLSALLNVSRPHVV
jgi:glycerol kinase